jgi:serine protease Do
MRNTSTLSRGAVVAMLAIGLAAPLAPLAAQERIVRVRGDSVMLRAFNGAKMDTLSVLVRALNHEPWGSPAWLELSHRIDSIAFSGEPNVGRVFFRTMPKLPDSPTRGWVGFVAQGPSTRFIDEDGENVTYLAYPSILSVDPQSPADRAGMIPGDVLIAFNGTDVVGHEFNLSKLFVPDKRVGVTVRRDGETKDFALEVRRAPEPIESRRIELSRIPAPLPPLPPNGTATIVIGKADGDRLDARMRRATAAAAVATSRGMPAPLIAGRFPVIGPRGVWGADVSPVGAELAKALKLEKGVLVNEIPDESPAFKAGVRAGDVITTASGQQVSTLGQLQDQVLSRLGDRSIALQVMRDHKPRTITVTW